MRLEEAVAELTQERDRYQRMAEESFTKLRWSKNPNHLADYTRFEIKAHTLSDALEVLREVDVHASA